MVTIARPALGEDEKKAVCEVIDSGIIACGKVVSEFEQAFADFCGAKYGVATTSGTTALEIALRSIGIGKGDKVLTTSYSFIASTNAIIYTGATPVFVDIDMKSYNISAEQLEIMLSEDKEIRAVLIVHLFGQPCDMDKITKIVKKYNVFLIEDCAQAHGAEINGKRVGTFGDVAAFSFYPTKNMTTGEGGMVVTNSEKIAEKARMLCNHGMKIRYHHDEIGYNYRMTNLAAAIGLCQLKKLPYFNAKRRENADYYFKNIKNELVVLPENFAGHVYHQYTIRVLEGKREKLIDKFESKEIGYGIFYPFSIPEQKCYADFNFKKDFINTDTVKKQVLSIPVHPMLSKDELDVVIEVINELR